MISTPLIEAHGLCVGPATAPRLSDVRVALQPGRVTLLLGPNGAGKSTLVRALLGLERASSGQVSVGGRALTALTHSERAAALGWLPQQPALDADLTAREVVEAARYRFDEPRRVAQRAAEDALDALGARPLASRPLTTLSGGEVQRVRLAALRAQQAAWWLLDEPGNHLDPAVRFEVVDHLRAHAQAGGGVVLVTHDLGLISHLPGAFVWVLRAGRVVDTCATDTPDLADRLGRAFGLSMRSVRVDGVDRLVVLGSAE